jgi:hypothetical protein
LSCSTTSKSQGHAGDVTDIAAQRRDLAMLCGSSVNV